MVCLEMNKCTSSSSSPPSSPFLVALGINTRTSTSNVKYIYTYIYLYVYIYIYMYILRSAKKNSEKITEEQYCRKEKESLKKKNIH